MFVNSKTKHLRMPSAKNVYEYWSDHLDVKERECFACGKIGVVQRCHIIPVCRNGDHSLKNIHLLCIGCHAESEGLKLYDEWFKYKRKHEWQAPMHHIMKMLERCGFTEEKMVEIGKEFDMDLKNTVENIMSQVYYGKD